MNVNVMNVNQWPNTTLAKSYQSTSSLKVMGRTRKQHYQQFSTKPNTTSTISEKVSTHSDYPGGSKTFHHLLIVWSRDLKFGHNFVRIRNKIHCDKCGLSPQRMFDVTKMERRESISTIVEIDNGINLRKNLSPHRLRFLIRHMQILIGDCNNHTVRQITES